MAAQKGKIAQEPEQTPLGWESVLPHTRKELELRLAERRFPHAVLLESGNMKLSRRAALTVAAGLLCRSAEELRPCRQCTACRKVRSGSHPDLLILEGTGGQRSLHVDDIRALRKDSVVLPNEAEFKVYVLLGAQDMSEQAQNAILKVLEEPPERVRFVLTCDDRAHLLGTILSRCTLYTLDDGEQKTGDDQAQQTAMAIASVVGGPSELELMRCTAAFDKDKRLMADTLSRLMLIFRQAMILKSGKTPAGETPEMQQLLQKLASDFSISRLSAMVQAVRTVEECMDRNANQNLMMTRLSALLRSAAGR